MVAVYDSTAAALAHTVTMTGTQPSAWTLYLCSTSAVMIHSSGVQRFQPKITEMGDVPTDRGGFGRSNFSLAVAGPYVATQGSFEVQYRDLLELLQVLQLQGATLAITLRAENAAIDEDETILYAEVSEVTDVTPTNVTIEYEIREAMENVDVPESKLTRTYWEFDEEKKRMPRESQGRSIPYASGSHDVYVPPALGALGVTTMTRDKQRDLRWHGLPARGFRGVPVQRGDDYEFSAWCERRSGGLSAPDWLSGSKRDVYVYESSVEAYARVYDEPYGVLVAHDAGWSKFHSWALYGLSWAVIPILPKRVSDSDCVGLTNGERALNTKLEEWATLAPGGRAVFELPVISSLGRIALNWRDGGGGAEDHEFTTAPAGIGIFAVCSAGSTVNNLPDMGKMFITWPHSLTALFGQRENLPFRSDMIADPLLPEVGRYDPELWRHTKLYNWDFSAETADTDSDLYDINNGQNAGQFRLVITRAALDFPSDAPLYIHWLGLRIGYEFSSSRLVGNGAVPNPMFRAGPGGRRRKGQAKFIDQRVVEDIQYPSSLLIDSPGLKDDGTGTFTGTPSRVLPSPLQTIHHWIDEYGGQSVVGVGQHGSFAWARTQIDRWATWAAGGVSSIFRSALQLETQSELGDSLFSQVLSGFPETKIRRSITNEWSAHVWVPFGSTYEQAASRYRALDPIDVLREIVFGDQGIELSFSQGWREIWNHIDVEYDIDPNNDQKRIASLTPTASDDGYGASWPVAPIGGAAAHNIAAYSSTRFGKRIHDPIRLLMVYDPATAVACGLHLLWRYYRPPVYASFSALPGLRDLKYGQLFVLSDDLEDALGMIPFFAPPGTTWSSLRWRCLGNERKGGPGDVYGSEVTAELVRADVGAEIVGGGSPEAPTPSGIFGSKQEHLNDEGWLP